MQKFITTFFMLLTALGTDAQRVTQEFQTAEALKSTGKYAEATLAFEYAFFISDDSLTKNSSLVEKAECLALLNKQSEAVETLKRITTAGMPDSFAFKSLYHSALYNFSLQEYESAYSDLNILDNLVKDSSIMDKTKLLSCLVNIQLDKWEEAAADLQRVEEITGINISQDSFFTAKPHLKSERKAALYSYLLPGAGQTYAGKPLSGLFSFTTTSASFSFMLFSALGGYYVTAATSGVWLFSRFYFGGKNHAGRLAADYNDRVMREYKLRISTKIRDTFLH